jgi:tRNA pseudouridine32 synthase/23S rRNA pseudouridine746 synthase
LRPNWQPPLRDGVAASRVVVGATAPGTPLLAFLQARFAAVVDWPQRLARGDVCGAQGQALQAHTPCVPGMVVWYWRSPPPEHPVPFELEVLHHDEHLVVVDKPHFLAVTPGGRHLHETALVRLKRQLGLPGLAPMHRIDRETAGLLVFTVQPATRHAYQSLLRDRQVHKVYEAIAPWRAELTLPLECRHRLVQAPGAGFMQMQVVAGEPNAQTLIELIARLPSSSRPDGVTGPCAHYRLTPHTGQKHQLRAQLNALGLPIVGDRIYPRLWPELPPEVPPDYSQPLQLLARALAFVDPITGQPRRFESRRRLMWANYANTG